MPPGSASGAFRAFTEKKKSSLNILARRQLQALSGLQWLVSIEDDAGRQRFRADELEGACRGSLRKEALPRAQQDRIDGQQDVIREPMLEQRRCQRGAAPEDEIRAVLRLDAANARDDVRPEALERSPFKTFRAVGRDILLRRI